MKRNAPSKYERDLIISDLHDVYCDFRALNVVLSVATEHPWDKCIINGDVCDFPMIATHDKKIRLLAPEFADNMSLAEELDLAHTAILRPLRKALGPSCKIIMRLGNHEARFIQVAETNTKAIIELLKTYKKHRSLELEDLLKLDRLGIRLDRKPIMDLYGIFTIMHGVKTSKGAPMQNLRRLGSGTSGHSHRMGAYTEVMHNRVQGWWESGCLRTVHDVEYLPFGDKPDWSQGFLELHINPERFFCIPHHIISYQTVFHGTTYAA